MWKKEMERWNERKPIATSSEWRVVDTVSFMERELDLFQVIKVIKGETKKDTTLWRCNVSTIFHNEVPQIMPKVDKK